MKKKQIYDIYSFLLRVFLVVRKNNMRRKFSSVFDIFVKDMAEEVSQQTTINDTNQNDSASKNSHFYDCRLSLIPI